MNNLVAAAPTFRQAQFLGRPIENRVMGSLQVVLEKKSTCNLQIYNVLYEIYGKDTLLIRQKNPFVFNRTKVAELKGEGNV